MNFEPPYESPRGDGQASEEARKRNNNLTMQIDDKIKRLEMTNY